MVFKTFTFFLVPEAINTGSSAKFNFQGKKNCPVSLLQGLLSLLHTPAHTHTPHQSASQN